MEHWFYIYQVDVDLSSIVLLVLFYQQLVFVGKQNKCKTLHKKTRELVLNLHSFLENLLNIHHK